MRYALIVLVCSFVVQSAFDQILYPRLVGGSVGLHPVLSIFALMSGATLFGVWGMLLGIPIIFIAKVISQHVEQLHPVAELLGE